MRENSVFGLELLEPRLLLSAAEPVLIASDSPFPTAEALPLESISETPGATQIASITDPLAYAPENSADVWSEIETARGPVDLETAFPPDTATVLELPSTSTPPSVIDSSFAAAAPLQAAGDQPLRDELQNLLRDSASFSEAVRSTEEIHHWVFNEVLSERLPLVGTELQQFLGSNEDLFGNVTLALDNAFNELAAIPPDELITEAAFRSALFNAFTPFNLLPGIASPDGLEVEFPGGNEFIYVELHLSGQLFSEAVRPKFDLGLPSLQLELPDALIEVSAQYELRLGIGIDTEGFYIETGPAGASPELNLRFTFELPGFNASGSLAFLNIQATANGVVFEPVISVDLKDGPDADTKLRVSELPDLTATAQLSGNVDLHLDATVSFAGGAIFPKLRTGFEVEWNFANQLLEDVDLATFGSAPEVRFTGIHLDVGSFFGDFLGPVVGRVKQVLEPLQPIINVLQARLPVLSDVGPLRDLFDTDDPGTDVTLLELIEKEVGADGTKFLRAVILINDIVQSIPSINGEINLGSFSLGANGVDPRGLPELKDIDLTNISLPAIPIFDQLNALGAAVQNFLNKLESDDLSSSTARGFTLPLIENPKLAFGLFLGKNVDLFLLDLPELRADFPLFGVDIPLLGPLEITIKGDLAITAKFAFGFDTTGLEKFALALRNDEFKPELIGTGFFIDDQRVGDEDLPELTLTATIRIYGGVDLVAVEAKAGGRIRANVDFNLNDPSGPDPDGRGRIRLDELIKNFERGLACVFDLEGKLTVGLEAYVRAITWEETFDIAEVTLLNFSYSCSGGEGAAATPVLATKTNRNLDPDSNGDVLRLNMGPYAAQRGSPLFVNTIDGDEHFLVEHVAWDEATGTETVKVTALGFSQTYSGIRKIYAEGGGGTAPGIETEVFEGHNISNRIINDEIILDEKVRAEAELWGDFNPERHPGKSGVFGNDNLTAGQGASELHGGGGADQLRARAGNTLLRGDDGNDLIFGGDGFDEVFGGLGDDRIYGGEGDDRLLGNEGDDVIEGGDGNDTIFGMAGSNRLKGGAGDDLVFGGEGITFAQGDAGNDRVEGNAGNDILAGDEIEIDHSGPTPVVRLKPGGGNDLIIGREGDDAIYGQAGDDEIFGDAEQSFVIAGNDYIEGNDGQDIIHGNGGDDQIFGGDGADTIRGGEGSDAIDGGSEPDDLFGDNGADHLLGQDGDDELFGGGGHDELFGHAGDDQLFGGDGNDRLQGGTGSDELFGGSGDDRLMGEDQPDKLHGEQGNDTLSGGAADDQLFGGPGSDTLAGDAGLDILDGQEDNDFLFGHNEAGADDDAAVDFIYGGSGSDLAHGGAGDDFIFGFHIVETGDAGSADTLFGDGGKDSIYGQGGGDTIFGGDGDDYLEGGTGNDEIHGNAGLDLILGGPDADLLHGDEDADRIFGFSSGGEGDALDTDQIFGGTGRDFIHGNNGADEIHGNQEDDELFGDGGADRVFGEEGDDLIRGGNEDETLARETGGGDWMLSGGPGNDEIHGEAGHDIIEGNAGIDRVFGGSGDDSISGGTEVDTINGNDGNDIILGESGEDLLYGDAGNDQIEGGSEDDLVFGSTGNDTIHGGSGSDVIHGEADHDVIHGNDGPDLIYGHEGNDILHGDAGLDVIYGYEGDDRIDGGADIDRIYGGIGHDVIDGGFEDDVIRGEAGHDIIDGNAGRDVIYGEEGNDTLSGGLGEDRIYGEAGDDVLFGQGSVETGDDSSRDMLFGAEGNDALHGNGGDDHLDGGSGADELHGGSGDDLLLAESGVGDRLFGEDGNDRLFGSDDGSDLDIDFTDANRLGDLLDGGAGDDAIWGLGGADEIRGG
ncbi:MAG: calcium-binding protein, partial [Verrucomicrobiota bacterium]